MHGRQLRRWQSVPRFRRPQQDEYKKHVIPRLAHDWPAFEISKLAAGKTSPSPRNSNPLSRRNNAKMPLFDLQIADKENSWLADPVMLMKEHVDGGVFQPTAVCSFFVGWFE
jgi:hypothetical protein